MVASHDKSLYIAAYEVFHQGIIIIMKYEYEMNDVQVCIES